MSTAELAGQTAEPALSAVAVRDLQVEIENLKTVGFRLRVFSAR